MEPDTAPKLPAYEYLPLNRARQDIRLFTLEPGDRECTIRGCINIVSLRQKPTFDALSYVWGQCDVNHEIQVDTRPLRVGRNLWHALRDIRCKDKSVVLWADAICIDQANTEERGHQVSLMGEIYETSRRVRAWLDVSLTNDDESFSRQKLSRLIDASAEANPPSSSIAKHLLRIWNLTLILANDRVQINPTDSDALSEWRRATRLFEDNYWHRLWIQQELLLAREMTFHLRQASIPGEYIFRLEEGALFAEKILRETAGKRVGRQGSLWNYLPEVHGGFLGPICTGRRLLKEQRSLGASTETSQMLLQMFMRSGLLQVKDPRDRLYGCLGLVPRRERDFINVSYTLTVVQVYAQVIRYFLRTHQTLDFLCHNGDSNSSVSVHTPSWLPNPECFPSINFENLKTMHHATLNRNPDAVISEDGLVLTACGTKVDSIASANRRPSLSGLSRYGIETELKSIWPHLQTLSSLELWRHQDVLDLFSLPSTPAKTGLRASLNGLLSWSPEPGFWETVQSRLLRSTVVFTATKQVEIVRIRDIRSLPVFGDEIWSLRGSPALLVLRPVPADSYWDPSTNYSVVGWVTSCKLSKQFVTQGIAVEESIDLV